MNTKKDSESVQLEDEKLDQETKVTENGRLTHQEMRSLELFGHVNALLQKDKELADLEAQLCDCKAQLWAEKTKTAINKKADVVRKIEENAKKNQSLNEEISARLELADERWGFNPLTGEVVGLTT
jgi:16S rRNA G1207 methylase RsmC